jgi:hypothetical protein
MGGIINKPSAILQEVQPFKFQIDTNSFIAL